MVIPPIRLDMLPHTAVLLKKISENGWGGGKYSETPLSHIFIEPAQSKTFTLSGEIPQVNAKLYFDSVNSRPKDISFQTGDIVRFEGHDFVVQKIEFFYACANKVHHLEVILT